MRTRARGAGSSSALWGGVAVVALLLIGATYPLAERSAEQATAEARDRAVRLVDEVLFEAIPPELAAEELVGAERSDLMQLVRSEILDDDRVARVLIWTPGGDLVFSSELADETQADDLGFSQAAEGAPASVVIGAGRVTGPFVRTFAPLRPSEGTGAYAVAQIDQRYDAIVAESTSTWRIARIVLAGVVIVAAFGFVLSFRRPKAPVQAPDSDRDAERMVELEDRAIAADRAKREAEERLAVAERRIDEASTLDLPPRIVAQIEDLEERVERESGDRERAVEEAQRLRETLDANEDRFARSSELVGEAERRAQEAEQRAAETEAARLELERHAGEELAAARREAQLAEQRTAELEAALAEARTVAAGEVASAEIEAERAERELAAAERELVVSQREAAADEREAAFADREAAIDEREVALAAREAALRSASAPTEPPPPVPEGPAGVLELTLVRDERDVARADLVRARTELDEARMELDEARARLGALEVDRPREPA